MKKVLFIIAITLGLTANSQESINDFWNYGADKQKHELIGYGYYESAAGVTVISATPILAKEWYDHSFKRGGFASEQDMIWGFQGVIEGAFTTATMYKVSDWMLNQKVHGVRDSYLAPSLLIGGGSAFLSEVVKFGVMDNYRPSILNFGIKTLCYGVSMLTKHHFDKAKGKHKYFEDKFKL